MKRSILKIALALGLTTGFSSISHAQGVLEGFGNDVPLSFAVKQIIPDGYLVNFDNGVNQGTHVKWRGGADWHIVLENVAKTNGLSVSYVGQLIRITPAGSASVSTQTSQVTAPTITRGGFVVLPPQPQQPTVPVVTTPEPVVSQPVTTVALPTPIAPPSPVTSRVPAIPLQASVSPLPVQASPLPAPTMSDRELARQKRRDTAQAPSANIYQDGTIRNDQSSDQISMNNGNLWKAPKGDTLDQVLAAWCEKSGWTLVFRSRIIYEMQAGAEFNGDFMEASSALIKSVRARPVPIATFYKGNHVLVINNNVDSGN
jgi:hypothetical protein